MNDSDDGGGCMALVLICLLIAAVVACVISLAALIDPFSWMPSADAIWRDCEDKYSTEANECALANRFPGFWGHAVANLAWTVVTAGLLLALLGSVTEYRQALAKRFESAGVVARCVELRSELIALSAATAAAAALPIAVAIF